ncbi:MAG TPA: PQQ-dependent sugar dehydrogenase [Bryobacteraceae bacterium]|nr:PQQ-dependent sugar dehydrogenase [Bryobacteraceae bacterium]
MWNACSFSALFFVFAAGASAQITSGQQKIPWNTKFNIPVAPTGLAIPPLPDHPVEFDTAEGQEIRVVVVTKELDYPFALAFLPDGGMLITERTGQIRLVRNGVLDPKPVAGGPVAIWTGESGLPTAIHGYMDIALHPKFAENHFIYLTYTKPLPGGKRTTAIARGVWNGSALTDVKDIFVLPGPSTSRIAFGSHGMLYMTTTGQDPQDPNTLGGKVLRLRDDGSVPPDNPFVGQTGHRPEVYALGIRSALGLALNPFNGEMWENENGPNGGDEINILKPGRNYGWPLVSYGRTYQGPWQVSPPGHAGYEAPIVIWNPAIAVSGMSFYNGDKFPKWKGDVFVGSLRTGEIPGTGHLERILFNDKWEELRREALLREFRQRIREVRQGPDGLIYVLTDANPGALLRIEPAP